MNPCLSSSGNIGANQGSNGDYGGCFTTDATSNSQDDDSQEISINVNCLYFDIVGGGKKRIAMVTDHVADKCIRVLEEEIVLMREIKSEFSSNALRRRYRVSGNRVKSSFPQCKRR
ncbi:hypothetical protein GH714_031578 [Hevea brasiliensis]|uniref:Uncharacterized protein n=1 Tax=Hevea brasiliensis TaxID=3981 RepID=A0A6A6N6D7_HEVBR|nr:hypothetical protein GH714_031578 [Hevea brasiliensis]